METFYVNKAGQRDLRLICKPRIYVFYFWKKRLRRTTLPQPMGCWHVRHLVCPQRDNPCWSVLATLSFSPPMLVNICSTNSPNIFWGGFPEEVSFISCCFQPSVTRKSSPRRPCCTFKGAFNLWKCLHPRCFVSSHSRCNVDNFKM
jgi:hypothetical protein